MNNPYPIHKPFSDYQMCKAILTLAHVPFREEPDLSGVPFLLVDKRRRKPRWQLHFTAAEQFMELFQNEEGFGGKFTRPTINDLTLSSNSP